MAFEPGKGREGGNREKEECVQVDSGRIRLRVWWRWMRRYCRCLGLEVVGEGEGVERNKGSREGGAKGRSNDLVPR